jgi:DNA primase
MDNKEIFRRIAAACSASDALILSGKWLKDAFGNSTQEPRMGKSYCSPLRDDKNPSFTLYIGRKGDVRFKDHGTGKSGSMINLLSELLSVSCACAAEKIDEHLKLGLWQKPKPRSGSKHSGPRNLKIRPIQEMDAEMISKSVGQDCREAINVLERIEMLGVGKVYLKGTYGEEDCFFLYDEAASLARVRKLDGSKILNAKSVCPKGYCNGPLGISKLQSDLNEIRVMEGEKDTLAVCAANPKMDYNPICMTGVTASFGEYAEATRGSVVTIYAQNDEAGLEAARRWVKEVRPYAEAVRVKVPELAGADWADLLSDGSDNGGFAEYSGEEAELLHTLDRRVA